MTSDIGYMLPYAIVYMRQATYTTPHHHDVVRYVMSHSITLGILVLQCLDDLRWAGSLKQPWEDRRKLAAGDGDVEIGGVARGIPLGSL